MRVESDDSEQAQHPYAYADPRSLSQAWYDALYGSQPHARSARPRDDAAAKARDRETSPGSAASGATTAPREAASDRDVRVTAPFEENGTTASHAALAPDAAAVRRDRLEARTSAPQARPTPPPSRNDVELRDADGNEIRLLLAQHGERVDVVAVTDPTAAGRVAEALESTRLALAARGISITSRVEERGAR